MRSLRFLCGAALWSISFANESNKEFTFTKKVIAEYTDEVAVESAGLCLTNRGNGICSTYGTVEQDVHGSFVRNSTTFFFQPYSTEPFVFDTGRLGNAKPTHIIDSFWLVQCRKQGESEEEFHVFDTLHLRFLSSSETNVYELNADKSWESVYRRVKHQYLVSNTGMVLKPNLGNGVRFDVVRDIAKYFQVPPDYDPNYEKILFGIDGQTLYYRDDLQTDFKRVPFTSGFEKCVDFSLGYSRDTRFVSVSCLNATNTYVTRYIAFMIRFQEEKWYADFLHFQDWEGIQYSEYWSSSSSTEFLRVIPTTPVFDVAEFSAIFVHELLDIHVTSLDLQMKLPLTKLTQQQLLLQQNSELGSFGPYHAKCQNGECLAAFIGPFARVNVYYTNKGNLDFEWVKRVQLTVPDDFNSILQIQVSYESEGSWIMMVVTPSRLYFGRMKPMERAGMVWLPAFDLSSTIILSGIYTRPPGETSYVATIQNRREGFFGEVIAVKLTENDVEFQDRQGFSFVEDYMNFEPEFFKGIEWGSPNAFVVVNQQVTAHFRRVSEQFEHLVTVSGGASIAFAKGGTKLIYRRSPDSIEIFTDDREEVRYEDVPILWGTQYMDSCKSSAISDRFVLVVCKDSSNNGYTDSILLDLDKNTFHGIAYKPLNYDSCDILSTERGFFIEFCVDIPTRTVRSTAFDSDWDKLTALTVVAEEPEPIQETFKIPLIVVSVVLGVALLVGGFVFFMKRQNPIEATRIEEATLNENGDVVVARPAL